MKTLIYLLSLISIISFVSCEKDEPFADCIDDPTCEYFRCKVDGEWWTPYCEQGPLFGCSATDVQYYRDLNGGGLELVAKNSKTNSSIVFDVRGIKVENIETKFYHVGFKSGDKIYNLDTLILNQYMKLIKIDTINFMLEGKFQLSPSKDKEIINITEGSFRLPYRF
jgi:hypothetical protein